MTTCKPFAFFLPCDPMPTPRPRVVVRGRFPSVYMPKDYMEWKAAAAEYVRGVNNLPPADLYERPITITMVMVVTRPRTTKLSHPGPDVDNYAKGILDAMTDSGRWWADDKYVVDLRVSKRWTRVEETPGVEVTVNYA